MFHRTLVSLFAALALVSCAHSNALPTVAPISQANDSVPQVWERGTPQSPWWSWTAPKGGGAEFLAKDASYNTWFVNAGAANGVGYFISKINMSGSFTNYAIPFNARFAENNDIEFGNDGNIWFADGNYIARVSPNGAIRPYNSNGIAQYLTPGFGSDIWFTNFTPFGWIGHMTYDGKITTYALPSAYGPYAPSGITRGPDGNIWFNAVNPNGILGIIGKLDPTNGRIVVYPVPSDVQIGYYLIAGPDKRLWTIGYKKGSTAQTNLLLAMNTNGAQTRYALPNDAGQQIAIGQDGALYLSAQVPFSYGCLDRVTTDGQVTVYKTPSSWFNTGSPSGAVAGLDGNIWFDNGAAIAVFIRDVMTITPSTVIFANAGLSQTISIAEKNYTGTWTAASTDPAVVRVAKWLSNDQVVITASGAGTARIIIRDSKNNYYGVTVTVK